MARFTFTGFSETASVALSAAQGGASAAGQVAAWGRAQGTLGIDIVHRTELVAPATVWLRPANLQGFGGYTTGASAAYDAEYMETEFFWDFDDPGSFQPPVMGLNIPDAWRDRSVGRGPTPSHTFHAPGIYTITCTAVSPDGTLGTATVQVEVKKEYGNADPADDPYDRIICFSTDPAEDWSEAPAQTTDFVTSWAALDAIWAALNSGTGYPSVLLLFKRGFAYPEGGFSGFGPATWVGSRRWGAFGSAPTLPKLPASLTKSFANYASRRAGIGQEFVIRDLWFYGEWDPNTLVGRSGGHFFKMEGFGNKSQYAPADVGWAMVRCYLSGLDNVAFWNNPELASDSAASAIVECAITGWRQNGMYFNARNSEGGDYFYSIVGTIMAQDADAYPSVGIDRLHYFGLRFENTPYVNLDANYLYNHTGYSAGGNSPGRFFSGTDGNGSTLNAGRHHLFVHRTVFEGGSDVISFEKTYPANIKFDTFMSLDTAEAKGHMLATNTAVTLLNGYFVGTTGRHPTAKDHFIARLTDTQPADATIPFKVAGCTFYEPKTTADKGTDRTAILEPALAALYSDLTVENNVLWAPNQDTPLNEGGPLDLTQTISGLVPRFPGRMRSPGDPDTYLEFPKLAGQSVANGATVDFPYPLGTGQAGFLATVGTDDRHMVQLNIFSTYHAEDGSIAVAFLPGGVRVTNTSGVAWSGDLVLALDRSTGLSAGVPDAGRANPSSLSWPRLAAGAGGLGTPGGALPMQYLDLSLREGAPHPDAPDGTPAAGAMPAL